MSKGRMILWGLVVVAGAVFAFLLLDRQREQVSTAFGAPFQLQTTSGQIVSNEDIRGNPHLIFFGFTNCPEVCPTTLYETTGWIEELGDQADKLKVYFISVDPERDTKEILADYLSPFAPTVTGLTGSVEEIDKTAKGYHVFYKKVPLDDGDYTMDHTASIFMMKADGSLLGTIAYGENSDTAIEKLKRLVNS